jgi:hypothetical protein
VSRKGLERVDRLSDFLNSATRGGRELGVSLPFGLRVGRFEIGHHWNPPVGRPPHEVRRYYASFSYRAQSWNRPRRVVAKVEWHPGELYPRVGFIITNLARPGERVVAFYNQRGTCEQYIKEGKNAIKWTRLLCRRQCRVSPAACAGL